MTDNQIRQAQSLLPKDEKVERTYLAYEGGIRLISKRSDGFEIRYKVFFNPDDTIYLEKF